MRTTDGKSGNSGIAHVSHSSPIHGGDGVLYFGDGAVSALRLNAALKPVLKPAR